jgi:hypothetical protein
MGRLVTFS